MQSGRLHLLGYKLDGTQLHQGQAMSAREAPPYFRDPAGREQSLTSEVTTIGRARDSDIIITGWRVSREHARVHRLGRRMVLADLAAPMVRSSTKSVSWPRSNYAMETRSQSATWS